jgi:outer membrane protein with glycine zipper
MIRLQKHGWLVVVMAGAALAACAQGEQRSQSADSTARNLTLAPTESTAALKDVPAPATEPARAARDKPAPEKREPKPTPPKPAAPTTLTAAAGTRVHLAASDTITTRHAKAGDAFTASISQDVKDAAGNVVIPAGSTAQGTIDAADPRPNPNSPGRLVLSVHSVTVRARNYPVEGTVVALDTVEQGRGVTKADAAKVGAGAAAGAIVGKLIGKDTKGALIGGLVGAGAGAAAARASRDIDIVLPKGAAFTVKLDKPLTVKRTT